MRTEEELIDLKCIEQIRDIFKRIDKLAEEKGFANSENSNTKWTKEEEAELRALNWVVEKLFRK